MVQADVEEGRQAEEDGQGRSVHAGLILGDARTRDFEVPGQGALAPAALGAQRLEPGAECAGDLAAGGRGKRHFVHRSYIDRFTPILQPLLVRERPECARLEKVSAAPRKMDLVGVRI